MPTSDSEDFESADEGNTERLPGKKGRKSRLSSSNYSGSTQDSDNEPKKVQATPQKLPEKAVKPTAETSDGWDDFDLEGADSKESTAPVTKKAEPKTLHKEPVDTNRVQECAKSQDTGWDDFDDWGQDDAVNNVQKKEPSPVTYQPASPDIKSIGDRLAATTVKEPSGGGWGWGTWGVDSLLSTATAGISTLTTHVSQGISTVLESGIGAPEPEALARQSVTIIEGEPPLNKECNKKSPGPTPVTGELAQGDRDAFQFGSLISGVTKFVESTGTKVIAGGLDTLETIGKKTMEVLQDGDPGLAKKRALLGLDTGDKPVLSQVLKEAKTRADEEDRVREEKREAKEVHYETLFDDFEGLVHLEALEMLSKQVSMRIEERLRSVDSEKRQEIKETLQQVSELCEMPEEDDDDESEAATTADAFHERLQEATQDLGLKLQLQPLVDQYAETLAWLSTSEATDKAVYKRCVAGLAQYTALSVEVYHKTAEMLLVKTRRSTADEADALTQMTVVLTKQISELATRFTEKLNSLPSDNKAQINTYITNVFLEAGNSSTYIQNAFQLALPILQIGAV